MDELLNPKEFADVYNTQINIGNLYNQLLTIQYESKNFLLSALTKECELLGNQLGNGYFRDAHWLKEPLPTESAYHLYCMQIIHP